MLGAELLDLLRLDRDELLQALLQAARLHKANTNTSKKKNEWTAARPVAHCAVHGQWQRRPWRPWGAPVTVSRDRAAPTPAMTPPSPAGLRRAAPGCRLLSHFLQGTARRAAGGRRAAGPRARPRAASASTAMPPPAPPRTPDPLHPPPAAAHMHSMWHVRSEAAPRRRARAGPGARWAQGGRE